MKILILGMHRSGTSMLTNLLINNGFYTGNKNSLLPDDKGNPKGYGERADLVELNNNLLESNSLSWYNPVKINNTIFTDESIKNYEQGIKTIIKELNKNEKWIIKDPRLSLIIPYFLNCLTLEEQKELKIIRIIRDPFEVAQSLKKRNEVPIDSGVALWNFYNMQILKNLEHKNYITVNYNQLLNNPTPELNKINTFLKTKLEVPANSIEPALYRNKKSNENLYPSRLKDIIKTILSEGKLKEELKIDNQDFLLEEFKWFYEIHLNSKKRIKELNTNLNKVEILREKNLKLTKINKNQNLVNQQLKKTATNISSLLNQLFKSKRWKYSGILTRRVNKNSYTNELEKKITSLLKQFH